MLESDRAGDGRIIRRMRVAWWMSKVADTHSEYLILIALLQ